MQHQGIHVVHHRDGSWQVKRAGLKKPAAIYWTQPAAEHRGRMMAQHEADELIIHDRSGQIVSHDTYAPTTNTFTK